MVVSNGILGPFQALFSGHLLKLLNCHPGLGPSRQLWKCSCRSPFIATKAKEGSRGGAKNLFGKQRRKDEDDEEEEEERERAQGGSSPHELPRERYLGRKEVEADGRTDQASVIEVF